MYIYIKDGKIMASSETPKDYSDMGWVREETDEEIVQVNGQLYKQSEVPEKSVEEKQNEVRNVRNQYLEQYVDGVVSNPLRWADMSQELKDMYTNYRRYLLDYTNGEYWWEKNPVSFDEWKEQKDELGAED